MMVSLLTSSRYSELNSAWMPSSNTSNLPQTLVSLPRELLGVPPACNTFKSMTLGNTNDINHFILGKDSTNWNLLLKMISGEIDLVSNGAPIKLDLHDVSLLLPTSKDFHLGMNNNPDCGAVFFHLSQILLNFLLSKIISPFSARFGKSLLLGLRPILVKSPLGLFTNMFCPNGLKCPHTTWSFNVPNNTNSHHGRSFNDSHSLNNLLFVDFRSRSVDFSDDVRHTSFVTHKASHVDWLRRIIFGEGFRFTLMTF